MKRVKWNAWDLRYKEKGESEILLEVTRELQKLNVNNVKA
jgi:hypothetical protein